MATLNLGRIKPVFRGAYSGGTAYVVDDIVTHGNESFICIQAHGAGTQATSVTAYWTKLAAKGTDGTDVGTTITTQGDILYRDGSGLARLGFGTSGHVLTTKGTGANPTWEAAVGGKIGQVLSVTQTSALSTTATSWTDISALTLTITPAATSSKILWSYHTMTGSSNQYGHIKITYGDDSDLTTAAIAVADGSRSRDTSGGIYMGASDEPNFPSMQGLDAPNTTSATTYKLRWFLSSGTLYLNRRSSDTDNATYGHGVSTLTLMEVLA